MRIVVAVLSFAVACLIATVSYQQTAIDEILDAQSLENSRIKSETVQLEELRRVLNGHLKMIEDMRKDLDFVERQSDILVAASRSGRNGHRVITAWTSTMEGK